MNWLLKDKFLRATWAIRNKNLSSLQKHVFMALEHGTENEIISFFNDLRTSYNEQYDKLVSDIIINYLDECLEDGVFSIDELSNVEQILKLANREKLSIYKTATFAVTELVSEILREYLIDEVLDEKEEDTLNALCQCFKMSSSDVEHIFLLARLAILDRNNYKNIQGLQKSDLRLTLHIPASRQFDLQPLRKGEYVNIWTKSYKDRVYFYQAGIAGRGKIGWLPIEQCSTLFSRLIESEYKGLHKHYIYDANVHDFNKDVTIVKVVLYSDKTIIDRIESERIEKITKLNNQLKEPYSLKKTRNIHFKLNEKYDNNDFKVSLLNRQQYLSNPDNLKIHLVNGKREITGISIDSDSVILPVIRSIYSGQSLKISVSERTESSLTLQVEPKRS